MAPARQTLVLQKPSVPHRHPAMAHRALPQIDRLSHRYRRNGFTQWERRDLQNRVQNLRQQLRWERQEDRRDDRRDRWDDDDRYDDDRWDD